MPNPAPVTVPDAVVTPGWIVVDPSGAVYAWYSRQIAPDIAAVWKLLGRTTTIRKRYAASGWTGRAGSWPELFGADTELAQVSA